MHWFFIKLKKPHFGPGLIPLKDNGYNSVNLNYTGNTVKHQNKTEIVI